ncbi:hypothetical protein DM01DRAFT_1406481 [Hesseltinella vesiculosa]|uniref:Uncharacterized protein n=1 Tax=Hesseltinella vesiculosa TaxID=101127 RepID=A0A1X2GMI4_9FUNG|nr:hypothetical protein DM01DRAFT_1406481 [Hesseltinella vesiculosa]
MSGEHFHSLVCKARIDPDAASSLAQQLPIYKDDLIKLLDNHPRNPTDRDAVKKGTMMIKSVERHLDDTFINEALFLSDILDLNEIDAVHLLSQAKSTMPSDANPIEVAVFLYYDDHVYLLAALDVLLSSIRDPSVNKESRSIFRNIAQSLMTSEIPKHSSFVAKLIATSDTLRTLEEKISESGGMPLQGTSLGNLGDASNHKRLERIKDERVYLVQIIYHLAASFDFQHQDIFRILDTLRLMDLTDITVCHWLAIVLAILSSHHFVSDAINQARSSDPHTSDAMDVTPSPLSSPDLHNRSMDLTFDCLQSDVGFIDSFHQDFTSKLWKVPALKATVAIQWVAFLASARQLYPSVNDLSITTSINLEEYFDAAIDTKALVFLNDFVLYFQQPDANTDIDRHVIKTAVIEERRFALDQDAPMDSSDFTLYNAFIAPDFQPFVIKEIETMLLTVILTMADHLRSLKYREEDSRQARANAETNESASQSMLKLPFTTPSPSPSPVPVYCGLEQLFTAMASVYRHRLNQGLKFWYRYDNPLNAFVKHLTDVRERSTARAIVAFFSAIAGGDQCAPLAFQLMEAGTDRTALTSSTKVSWGMLFACIQYYLPIITTSTKMDDNDESLLIELLSLMQQVVLYSPVARHALWQDPLYQTRDSLLQLVSRPISSLLRAALLNTLAAFATSWGGGIDGLGASISAEIWLALEASDYLVDKLPTAKPSTVQNISGSLPPGSGAPPPAYWGTLNMEKEKDHGYHETLALLKLLGDAIHTPNRRDDLLNGFPPMASTLPPSLGLDTRPSPGGKPYVRLVVDILTKLSSLSFQYPGTQWQLTAACLKVLENSLDSFDLQLLASLNKMSFAAKMQATGQTDTIATPENMQALLYSYVTHPGYSVMLGMLSYDGHYKKLFELLDDSLDRIADHRHFGPYYIKCVLRTLRIMYRVLQLQDSFINVLLPSLAEKSQRTNTSKFKLQNATFDAVPRVVSLGQHLLSHSPTIVQIALLTNAEEFEEICCLSTRVLDALATGHLLPMPARGAQADSSNTIISSTPTLLPLDVPTISTPIPKMADRIAKILSSSKSSSTIRFGVEQRLAIDQPELTSVDDYLYDINNIPFWTASKTIRDSYPFDSEDDVDMARPQRICSVRIALLDLLVNNVALDTITPNVAEYLLGYMDVGRLSPVFNRILSMMAIPDSKLSSLALLKRNKPLSRLSSMMDLSTDNLFGLASQTSEMDEDSSDDLMQLYGGTLAVDKDNDELLVQTHPILAEKCYRLMYQLCAHPTTAHTTLRILRTEHDYFFRQCAALYGRLETDAHVPVPTVFAGNMILPDNTSIASDALRLPALLHQRAWFLESLALELHYLADTQQKANITTLLDPLFRADVLPGQGVQHPRFDQTCIKVVELLRSLDFRWQDGLLTQVPDAFEPVYFPCFDATPFKTTSARGCEVFDMVSIYAVLVQEYQARAQATATVTPSMAMDDDNKGDAVMDAMREEMYTILSVLMAENHSREIIHARLHCLRAWKQVIHVALTDCADFFDADRFVFVVYALLEALFPAIAQWRDYGDVSVMKALSQLVMTLVARLVHQDPSVQAPTQSSLPPLRPTLLTDHQLLYILTSLVKAVHQDLPGQVRGNFYMAIVNVLQYVQLHCTSAPGFVHPLKIQLVDYLASCYDDLMSIMCNDACYGLGVWRTTALTALSCLYELSQDVNVSQFLSLLIRRNFLRFIIDTIKKEDELLVRIVSEPEASLYPLYIYEAEIALLTRISCTKEGAQCLIDNGIMDVIGRCEFLRSHPKENKKLLALYNELLQPTLVLITGIVTVVGKLNGTLLQKAEHFVHLQQDLIISVLRFDLSLVTYAKLEQMKLVTNLMYRLSCRPGYFQQMLVHNLSVVHAAMVHLLDLPSDKDILARISPANEQETVWAKTPLVENNVPTNKFVSMVRQELKHISIASKLYDHNQKQDQP